MKRRKCIRRGCSEPVEVGLDGAWYCEKHWDQAEAEADRWLGQPHTLRDLKALQQVPGVYAYIKKRRERQGGDLRPWDELCDKTSS